MQTPIIILARDSGDIMIFDSMDALSGSLEGIDIENDEYEAYSAHGERLELTTQKQRLKLLGLIPLSTDVPLVRSTGSMEAEALMEIIKSYLVRRTGVRPTETTLPALIKILRLHPS